MMTLFTLLLVLVLPCCCQARQTFIDGGSGADISSHPHQGSFRNTAGTHLCGCVLVATNWALTAAHCGGNTGYTTEWGATERGNGEVLGILTLERHPYYGVGTGAYPNDISVMELDGSVTTGTPITIASDRMTNGNGVITGWGMTCPYCEFSPTLQAADISIITDQLCYDRLGANYNSNIHICVWDTTSLTSGPCFGDNGGALVAYEDGELHGLCSMILAYECVISTPALYTRVSYFRSWVCEKTENVAEGCAAH